MLVRTPTPINYLLFTIFLSFFNINSYSAQTVSTSNTVNEVAVFIQHTLDAQGIVYSDQGNYFMSAESEGVLTLWDARSMKQLRTFKCNNYKPIQEDIQIIESSNQLACKCKGDKYNEVIKIYDLAGKLTNQIEPEGSIEGFSLAQNSYYTSDIFENDDNLIKYNLSTQQVEEEYSFKLKNVKINHNFDWIVGIGDGNEISIINISSQETVAQNKTDKKEPYISDFRISPDGTMLLVLYPMTGNMFDGSAHHNWQVYNIAKQQLISSGELPFMLKNIFFSHDSQHLHYLNYDDSITDDGLAIARLFKENLETKKITKENYFFPADYNGSVDLAIHPHQDKIIIERGSGIDLYNAKWQKITQKSPRGISQEYTKLQCYNKGKNAILRNDRTIQLINFQYPLEKTAIVQNNDFSFLGLAGGSYWIEEDTSKYWEDDKDYHVVYNLRNANKLDTVISLDFKNEIVYNARVLDSGNKCLLLTSSSKGYKWQIIDLKSKSTFAKLSLQVADVSAIDLDKIILTADERYLFVASHPNKQVQEIKVYDSHKDFKLTHTIPHALKVIPTPNPTEVIVQFQKEEASNQYAIYLYDLLKQQSLKQIGMTDDILSEICVSQDNKYLICASANKVTRFPLTENDTTIALTHPLAYPTEIAVSNDLFYVYSYNKVICFDLASMKE